MAIPFAKYHGAGNDFILIDNRTKGFDASVQQVAALCHRRTGIGADGLMLLEEDPQALFRMRYFNADGSEASMCGNGGRCIALFAHHLGIGTEVKHFVGVDGPHTATILADDGVQGEVRLGMIDVDKIADHGDYLFLNTGSPHYVSYVTDVRRIDVVHRGGEIRHSRAFASIGGTNVNFVQLIDEGHIRIRTFERGVEDETLACGTGATACALATALRTGSPCRNYRVDVEGGTLYVALRSDDLRHFTEIFLSGPACKVFEGSIHQKTKTSLSSDR